MENGSYLRKPQTVLRQARPLHQLLSERGALLALRSTRAGGEAGAPARKDLPADLGLREAVNEIAELGCNASGQPIATGEGALTSALAAAFSQGARDVAGALRQWMSRDQARQLESHLAHGRVLLWVQPVGSEEFSCVCHLVRTSPYVVEVCDVFVKDGGSARAISFMKPKQP